MHRQNYKWHRVVFECIRSLDCETIEKMCSYRRDRTRSRKWNADWFCYWSFEKWRFEVKTEKNVDQSFLMPTSNQSYGTTSALRGLHTMICGKTSCPCVWSSRSSSCTIVDTGTQRSWMIWLMLQIDVLISKVKFNVWSTTFAFPIIGHYCNY